MVNVRHDLIFAQATIYLGAAVIASPLAAQPWLGSVLGSLMGGMIIGFTQRGRIAD
jgi:hypothetical protein